MSKSDKQVFQRRRKWAKKGLRQMERRINEKKFPTEKLEKAFGELAKLAYYMLDDLEKVSNNV